MIQDKNEVNRKIGNISCLHILDFLGDSGYKYGRRKLFMSGLFNLAVSVGFFMFFLGTGGEQLLTGVFNAFAGDHNAFADIIMNGLGYGPMLA